MSLKIQQAPAGSQREEKGGPHWLMGAIERKGPSSRANQWMCYALISELVGRLIG
jgi:hypothetical protein